MKEMMEAIGTEMQSMIQAQQVTIQAQQSRMEHLESQLQAMGGSATPNIGPLEPLQTGQVLVAYYSS